jgi:hypothetical protein
MKISKIICITTVAVTMLTIGCKKSSFVELNTDPNTLYSILPEEQFLNAGIRAHNSDFEAYYDQYRRMMPWMQMSTFQAGNGKNFLNDVGNFNQRYGVFYPELGTILTDVQHLIDIMPEEEKAKRVHMRAIPDILKVYYAFYVSDINGSIPYTEAFQARYGGTLTPKYESQQELFPIWDAKLKEVIGILKSSQTVTQVSLGANDLYYQGNVSKWIKAANALRLKIGMRLMKRDPDRMKTIAMEVIADQSALMTSNADSWAMYGDVSFTQGGNFDPSFFRAPKPTVDFMWKNSDPRIRMYYQRNNYSQANINVAIDSNKLAAGTTESPRRYVGAHISPDSSQGRYVSWYAPKMINASLTLDTVSYIQYRMFQAAYNGGTGKNVFPIINYADFLLMRAELAARGVTTENARNLYEMGIEASLRFYDNAARLARLPDYVALTDAEIEAYKAAPDVAYNAIKAVEQIVIQEYLNYFKQPNEAWALYKRTGLPNKNTALANEDIVIDGTVRQIPRRAAISVPDPTDLNYANKKAALDAMAAEAGFGSSPSDMLGRVWWDKP